MTRLGLARSDTLYPMGSMAACLPSEHVERFGARMRMHRRDAARRAAGFIDPKEILRCNDPRDRSNFHNLGAAR